MSAFFKPAIKEATRQNVSSAYKSVAVGADTKLAAVQSRETWANLRDSTSKAYTQNFDQQPSFKTLPAAAIEVLQSVIPSRLVAAFSAAKGGDRFDNQAAKGYSAEGFGIKPQQAEAGISLSI